jgi:hypothetical protein
MKTRRYLVLSFLLLAAAAPLFSWAPWTRTWPRSKQRVYTPSELQALAATMPSTSSNKLSELVENLQDPETRVGESYSWAWKKLPYWLRSRLPDPTPPYLETAYRETQRKQLNDLRRSIRKESFQRSVSNLITNDQWSLNELLRSSHLDLYGAGLNRQIGLDEILASRRALKVVQAIESLPPAKASRACRQVFDEAFAKHTNAIGGYMAYVANPSAPRNQEYFAGAEMAIRVAMFSAADLGLRDVLAEQFRQLENFQAVIVAQESRARANGHTNELRLEVLVNHWFPDTHFRLNVLYLAATRSKRDADALLRTVSNDPSTNHVRFTVHYVPITHWDAKTTWFETSRLGAPMDARKGLAMYTFLDWGQDHISMSPDAQEDALRKLQKLTFE